MAQTENESGAYNIVFAVFALFVFMLTLLGFCVLPFFSVNKDLYIIDKVPIPWAGHFRC